jgi:hypothetical protein
VIVFYTTPVDATDGDGDLPGRCGYWLGWDLMNSVLTQVPLGTAMTWPLVEASGRLQRQLEFPELLARRRQWPSP